MTPRSTVSTRRLRLISAPDVGEVLSLHLDGRVCAVGCEFCYLGQRALADEPRGPWLSLLEDALARLQYREVAVAISEPAEAALLQRIRQAAGGRRLSVTTTLAIARSTALDADRVNLSIDPR